MTKTLGYVFSMLLSSAQVHAEDAFQGVQCGPDIAKTLKGQRVSDEAAAAIERRHAALGLKNLGGSEISDHLFVASWLICGKELALLVDDRSIVRDILPFPAHDNNSPGFTGACTVDGKTVPETVIAVLRNEAGTGPLPATAAWKIDEKGARFTGIKADGLRCPRDGIFTSDGGR